MYLDFINEGNEVTIAGIGYYGNNTWNETTQLAGFVIAAPSFCCIVFRIM